MKRILVHLFSTHGSSFVFALVFLAQAAARAMAGKARASAVTRRAKRRARPGLQEAIRYSATLSASVWLGALKQTVGSKLVSPGGGESLPKAPEGSVLVAADKQLYFIGSVGKSALGQVSARADAVPPEKAGALLNACEQLWKEMKFNLAHPKKYQHLHYLTHTKWGRGDFSLWWCFSSVVLLCEVATRRKIVIPALKGVVCIFAVVLAGNVFFICERRVLSVERRHWQCVLSRRPRHTPVCGGGGI